MRDDGLDALLSLDGVAFFIDSEARYSVRFVVRQVDATEQRPHGLSYSLVLLGPGGERLVGFDNAHSVAEGRGPAGRLRMPHDHRHRFRIVRPYDYKDAATLLADFWRHVDAVLKEKGVLP